MIHDRSSSLFLLLISVVVLAASLQAGLGTTRQPGPGFITFGASVLLAILSLVLFLRTFIQTRREQESLFKNRMWWRVPLLVLAIIAYAAFIPVLGFLLGTFLLMFFVYFMIREQKWYWVILSSALSSIASYYLFSKLLNCQFPAGVLGLLGG